MTRTTIITIAAVIFATTLAGADAKPRPAYLLGLEAKGDKVTIAVISNGCTRKGHFIFSIRRGDGGTRLTVLRDQKRFCLLTPYAIRLTYTRKEIGLKSGERFVVTNPMGQMPKLRHRSN